MPAEMVKRHVGLALIAPARQGSVLSTNVRDDLLGVLDPSTKVERYRRVWRVSRLEDAEGFLCGKLGFSRRRQTEETFYDETRADFVTFEHDSSEGSVSHFVLYFPAERPGEAVLAFEEQPPDIRRQSFIGAFTKFLSDAHAGYEVQPIRREIEFTSWLEEMQRVTEFSGSFTPPNPRWRPRTEQVQTIVEETKADKLRLTAKVDKGGESLDVADSILGGIVEHSKWGYGEFSAKGERDGTTFNYRKGSSEVIEDIIEEAADTAGDIFHKLRTLVRTKIRELL